MNALMFNNHILWTNVISFFRYGQLLIT